MAPADFPLPRAKLPKMSTRSEAHKDAKRMMERVLEHTVHEFENHTYVRNNVVDGNRWRALSKSQASMNGQHDENVAVYSERNCGETSTDLAFVLQDNQSFVSATDNNSALAALTPSAVLVAGRAPGKVENIMYALGGAHTQEGLALFSGFMYDDVADCGVLHAVEKDDGEDENSCRFLGYKYVVKRSAASVAKLVPQRDFVYLESTGYTQTSNGERLGFHIENSVDVPGFPDLCDRNSSRVLQSVRYIFRQKSERMMEMYMLGNMDLAGALSVGGVGVGGSNGGSYNGDLFSIVKLQQCAEIRRLTLMVRRRRESIELLQTSFTHRNSECYLCHRTKRFFSSAVLAECDVCGQFVCTKCRNDKKLFIRDAATHGLLGKFQRAQTCKTCVLVASAGYAAPPMHMSVSQQVARNNQGTDRAGSVGRGSMSGRRYSGSSSSRASSGESSAASVESEFHSCRQGPVYTFSEAEEDKVVRPQPWQCLDQLQQQPTRVHQQETTAKSQPQAKTLLSSQMLGRLKEQNQRNQVSGQQRHELSSMTTPPLAISIAKARGRSGTNSSDSSASSDDSNSGKSRRKGIYVTPPNPSKLYEQEQQRRHESRHLNQNQHEYHLHKKTGASKQQHADQLMSRRNCQPSSRERAMEAYLANKDLQVRQGRRQLAGTTIEHSNVSDRALVNPYSNSYSGPSSTMSIAAKNVFPHFPPLRTWATARKFDDYDF